MSSKNRKRPHKKRNNPQSTSNGNRSFQPGTSRMQYRNSRSTSDESGEDYEIPGFYYDKEKKKYFKILPNTNVNAGVVTEDMIQRTLEEEARQLAIKTVTECTMQWSSMSREIFPPNLNKLLTSRSFYGPKNNWELDAMKSRLPHIQITKRGKLFPEPEYSYQSLDHMHALVPNKDCTKILGLWSLKGSLLQRIQMLKTGGVSRLTIDPFGPVLMKSIAKVTNIVWAPIASMDATILHTTMCLLGTSPSLALFRKLDSEDRDEFVSKEFNLGKNAAWTCAWNESDQKFSVGSERKALLIDFRTRNMWELNTDQSDVYTQQFSSNNPNLLYNGTKKGYVLLHDTRRSAKSSLGLKLKSAVCCLKLKLDENYLISEDFTGAIALWDMRKCRKVLKYPGQVNEYTRLQFGIDEKSDILYGCGQDSYTRIWSLNDARLLATVPPPNPASRDTIPSLAYSQNWGGRHHGLLMGTREEVVFYSI